MIEQRKFGLHDHFERYVKDEGKWAGHPSKIIQVNDIFL